MLCKHSSSDEFEEFGTLSLSSCLQRNKYYIKTLSSDVLVSFIPLKYVYLIGMPDYSDWYFILPSHSFNLTSACFRSVARVLMLAP